MALRIVYTILNKDKAICSFKWDDRIEGVLDVKVLESDKDAPSFIVNDTYAWLKRRIPPKNRSYMDILLERMSLTTVKSIVDYSKGLSLTDTFWVTHDLSLKWKDVNLFNNDFDEVISHIAFDGGLYGGHIKTISPEFGTDGMLPKCWVRDKSTKIISLKKGSTEGYRNAGNEPYSEVMSSQILSVLKYPHVDYTLEKFRDRIVSSCPLITNEKVMMMPIHTMCDITTVLRIEEFCRLNNLLDSLYQIFIFDYLTNNSDRHGSNFSVLLDSDTYELIGMAPIYDNGCALLCYHMVDNDLKQYLKNYIPALYDSYSTMANIAKKRLKSSHNVNKLINFKFDRSQVRGYSDEKIDLIEKFLQTRVQEFLSW